jgi:hypothetical protein
LLAQAYLLASSVLGLSQRWALLCAPLCFLGSSCFSAMGCCSGRRSTRNFGLDVDCPLEKRHSQQKVQIQRKDTQVMKRLKFVLFLLLISLSTVGIVAQAAKYPPLSEYLMPQDAEIALAKSAAPDNISDKATIKVLTASGFQVVHEGSNGFVCLVMRGSSAPTYTPAELRNLVYDAKLRAPICFNPQASQTVLPYYDLRNKLALEGKTPDQIAEAIQAAYSKGLLPKRDGVSFAYMWSADQKLGSFGHWHPHMMIFCPQYENSMLGGNPFGALLPIVTDDAGTPFAVVVIPVDDKLAIKARP